MEVVGYFRGEGDRRIAQPGSTSTIPSTGDGEAAGLGHAPAHSPVPTASGDGPRRVVLTSQLRRLGRRVPGWHGHPLGDAAVVIVGVIVVALIAIVGVRVFFGQSQRPAVSMNRGTTLGATAPLGWSRHAMWSTPALLKGAGRILPVGQNVALITADRQVTVVDAPTGEPRWARGLPDGELTTALTLTSIGGRDVIAVQVGQRLVWWQPDSGEERAVDLPARAVSTFLGEAPLIGLDATTVGTIGPDAAVRRYQVPKGAIALAAQPDGRVTAAAPTGWWHLRPDTPPGAPRPFPPADPAAPASTPTVISYLGGYLLTLTGGSGSTPAQLVVYSDIADTVHYSFSGPIHAAPVTGTGTADRALAWRASPSGTWGVFGRTLVDLREGRLLDLGAWSTTHVAEDRALGLVAGQSAIVGPDIPRGLLTAGEAFPEAMTAAGVAIRAAEGADEVIYVLPWMGSDASSAPEP